MVDAMTRNMSKKYVSNFNPRQTKIGAPMAVIAAHVRKLEGIRKPAPLSGTLALNAIHARPMMNIGAAGMSTSVAASLEVDIGSVRKRRNCMMVGSTRNM